MFVCHLQNSMQWRLVLCWRLLIYSLYKCCFWKSCFVVTFSYVNKFNWYLLFHILLHTIRVVKLHLKWYAYFIWASNWTCIIVPEWVVMNFNALHQEEIKIYLYNWCRTFQYYKVGIDFIQSSKQSTVNSEIFVMFLLLQKMLRDTGHNN